MCFLWILQNFLKHLFIKHLQMPTSERARKYFPTGIYLLKVNNRNTRVSMKYVQN